MRFLETPRASDQRENILSPFIIQFGPGLKMQIPKRESAFELEKTRFKLIYWKNRLCIFDFFFLFALHNKFLFASFYLTLEVYFGSA